MESFYAAVRKATPQVRALAERYGGDVSCSFDSNGRSGWVMACSGKTLLRSPLRDGPSGLLRVSGIWPEGPRQGARIRKRIYEMLHQERSRTKRCRGYPWMRSERRTEPKRTRIKPERFSPV